MKVLMTIVSAFIFLGPLTSFGANKAAGGRYKAWLAQELNLSPDQIDKVKQIKSKYKPTLKEKKQLARSAKEELIQSLQAPKRGLEYRKSLLEKFKKVQNLKQEQHLYRFEMALEIRELLTDEQIVKFKALHRQPRDKKEGDNDNE